MRLQYCTWPEVEEYLQSNTGIIIPIGSTEQHGPTGLIGTDAICPELVAWEVGKKHHIMVAPTLSIGIAQHHLGFTGSMTLRPSTMIAMIEDVVTSLAKHGFTHMFFLNGHGGNIAPLHTAFAEVYTASTFEYTGLIKCNLCNWFEGERAAKLAKELYGDSEGFHATPSEVALSYLTCPEKFRQEMAKKLEPEVAPDDVEFRDADDYRQKFPDGRIASNPQLATVEAGKQFLQLSTQDVFESFQKFLQD